MRPFIISVYACLILTLVTATSGCGKDETESVSTLASSSTGQNPSTQRSVEFSNRVLDSSGRELYPDISFIETEEVKENLLDYTLVDVRSNFEFRTAHMLDAVSIPASDQAYIDRLRNLVRKYKPEVILYGNGGNDRSAHEAARAAAKAEIENIFVYDGSMQDWAMEFPELALLNGQEISLENPLIGEEEFSPKLLSDDDFRNKVTSENGMLLDIRDESDSNRHPLQGMAVINPLDHTGSLTALLEEVKANDTPLFIFDDYGYKVRWLMYKLERQGIENYHFLKDGLLN